MNQAHALTIVSRLANGNDPATGGRLSLDTPLRKPEVQHALALACRALEQSVAQHQRVIDQPANAGKPWSEEHDTTLKSQFAAGTEARELANLLGRSKAAIEARLILHGLMEPSSASQRLRF